MKIKTVAELKQNELYEIYWEIFSAQFQGKLALLILNNLDKRSVLNSFHKSLSNFLESICFNPKSKTSYSLLIGYLMFLCADVENELIRRLNDFRF